MSIKDTRLQILLDNEQVKKYMTMMLMSFQQDGGYLDRLMAWLTDIDNLPSYDQLLEKINVIQTNFELYESNRA